MVRGNASPRPGSRCPCRRSGHTVRLIHDDEVPRPPTVPPPRGVRTAPMLPRSPVYSCTKPIWHGRPHVSRSSARAPTKIRHLDWNRKAKRTLAVKVCDVAWRAKRPRTERRWFDSSPRPPLTSCMQISRPALCRLFYRCGRKLASRLAVCLIRHVAQLTHLDARLHTGMPVIPTAGQLYPQKQKVSRMHVGAFCRRLRPRLSQSSVAIRTPSTDVA
jgi:hypothetical protein